MRFYLAPMEGLTGYVYRNAYNKHFAPMDAYYSPFISPTKKRMMKSRDERDVAPENNMGIKLVPQIMSKEPEQIVSLTKALYDMGYMEVNLNAGCPSMTVVSKGKGAGLLKEPTELDRLLYGIFEEFEKAGIDAVLEHSFSIKTRIGIESVNEFEDILAVYNKYPISKLILHPRLQNEYYNGKPHMDMFDMAYNTAKMPLCYNGDIFSVEEMQHFIDEYPELDGIMLGRGILRKPTLLREYKGGETLENAEFKAFHDCLVDGYREELKNDKDMLFKLKELWFYLNWGGLCDDKELKRIRKAGSMSEYSAAVNSVFVRELS